MFSSVPRFLVFPLLLGAGLLSGCAGYVPQPHYQEIVNKYENQRLVLSQYQKENDELRNRVNSHKQLLDKSNSDLNKAWSEMATLKAKFSTVPKQENKADSYLRGVTQGLRVDQIDVIGDSGIRFDGELLFASGKVTLKSAAKTYLKRLATQIKKSNDLIRIEGHADRQPIRKSKYRTNFRLSTERALSVQEFLVNQGVQSSRIVVAGFAEHQPVSASKSKRANAKDRRVDIYFISAH